MSRFIPGLQLSELFYRRLVAPILRRRMPGLHYSAGLIGPGSEVLGVDDLESSDHHWGLRLILFVDDSTYRKRGRVRRLLSDELATDFLGHSTNFSPPDPQDNNVRLPARVAHGPVNHMIEIDTPGRYFKRKLGVDPNVELSESQWLALRQQPLLELTSGRIFHDGLREVNTLRRRFAFFPRRVWLELLARKWDQIGEEEAFVARTGFRGDEFGSRLIAARQVQRMMELCFLIERRYAPYSKWFGTAFTKLRCARRLSAVFERVLAANTWRDRERRLSVGYEALARMHNRLGVTPPLRACVSRFHSRSYLVIHGEHFAAAIRSRLRRV